MKFYQLILSHNAGESAGFEYFTTLNDAERTARKWAKSEDGSSEIKVIEIEPSKSGILRALNHYASHPDNG
jgi:hypothetical protein